MRPRWLRLVLEDGSYNPRVRELANGRSGAYAVRERDSHRVMYVGESSCGKLWKTMLRHFQAPDSFAKVRETGVFRRGPTHYEVAIWPTSTGNRRCTRQGEGKNEKGDQRALNAQARWIAMLRPEKNKDDGQAFDAEEFRAHRARQAAEDAADPFGMLNPGSPRVVVDAAPERRAENRTPDLWTGRTKLEDRSGKARRDWKGEAERLARELAECRRAPSSMMRREEHAEPPPPAPRPEGYGETDERGQARMFRRNPKQTLSLEPIDVIEASPPETVERLSSTRDGESAQWRTTPHGRHLLIEWNDDAAGAKPWAKWLVDAASAYRKARTGFGGDPGIGAAPGITARASEKAQWMIALAERMPKIPKADPSGWGERPWSVMYAIGKDRPSGLYSAGGATSTGERGQRIGEVYGGFASGIAVLAELSDLGELLRSIKKDRSSDAARKKARKAYDSQRTYELWRQIIDWLDAIALDAISPAPRVDPHFAAYREEIARDLRASRKRDAAHAAMVPPDDDGEERASDRELREAAERHAFRKKAAARFARAPEPKKKPEGYGEEVTTGKRAGQFKLFNPRGTLTNMGALTEMQGRDLRTKRARVLRWPISKAPTLAYDDAGRLFIVYGGRVERPTTAKESAEYRRTHWGRRGRGVVTSGGVAVPPFRRLMVAESITYTTEKGTDSAPIDYVHAWGEGARGKWLPPIVVEHECHPETCRRGSKCAAAGAVALMGGTYTVDDRGIVG